MARLSSLSSKSDFYDRYIEDTHSISIQWKNGDVRLAHGFRHGIGVRSAPQGGLLQFQSIDDPADGRDSGGPVHRGPGAGRRFLAPREPRSGGSPSGSRMAPAFEAGHVECSDPGGCSWEQEVSLALAYVEKAAEAALSECRGTGVSLEVGGNVDLYHQAVHVETREGTAKGDTRSGARIEMGASGRGRLLSRSRRRQAGRDMREIASRRAGEEEGRFLGSALMRRQEAQARPLGMLPVVFDPGGCAALLHEIGHLFEAGEEDGPPGPWVLGNRIGRPDLTIVDDPGACRGRGSYSLDDEGEEGRPAVLLDRGVVAGTLRSAGMSAGSGSRPTGHGRRSSYRDLPLPRMACTYMLPGTDEPDEMIKGIARGLYVTSLTGGAVDPGSGRVTLVAEEGFMIEQGRLAGPASNALLLGQAAEILEGIDAIGHDLRFDHGAGDCLKADQSVPVMVGLPTIRLRVIRVITP